MKRTTLQALTVRAVVPSALMLLMSVPADAFAAAPPAQDHLVSAQAMQKQMSDSAAARQKNVEAIRGFLSGPVADRAMRDAQYNPEQVKNAIPALSDQELASLAARSNDAQEKFAAGALTRPELALIVIALVVVIVVIIVH
ncbi:MAG: PA2779 family protein [Acidobacteria bacterium]|nr:PA2779 family protein [Acidobacteriota bacterium]